MFRQEAVKQRNTIWKAKAILLPGIPLWCIALSALFFITFLISFITFGSYTRRINISAEITTWPRPIIISTNQQGYVARSLVQEGQTIEKGSPIYELDTSKATRFGVVSDNELKEITDQINNIRDIINSLEKSKEITLKSIKEQQIKYKEAYDISSNIVLTAEQGLNTMKNSMRNYEEYQKKGLINKDQLTNQISLYYQQQYSLLNIKDQNIQNSLQITNLESQIQIQKAEFDNRIFQMKLQENELKKELINTGINQSIIIKSPSQGIVDTLNVTQGQMVNVGDTISQIVPLGKKELYLILWVPDIATPFIKHGDTVSIRYDAFPYEKFGQFKGSIYSVSKTPASQQEITSYHVINNKNFYQDHTYYRVIIKPENDNVYLNGNKINLESGMKAELTLYLENRKIYEWMLSPFYDIVKSAKGNMHE
ncbi:HlyD family secretion protein [Klebsiella oxytoca]|uniref:HlyD family secretion protein n=1 Tax=Klebsiella oxytoca TaxID=571 RepID=UPI001CCF46D4|nr:HlyD family secretion protein [Klebsiella oxytoca]MBZ7636773.1 HlyD family secretion protein [Klebsiella oxytoca]